MVDIFWTSNSEWTKWKISPTLAFFHCDQTQQMSLSSQLCHSSFTTDVHHQVPYIFYPEKSLKSCPDLQHPSFIYHQQDTAIASCPLAGSISPLKTISTRIKTWTSVLHGLVCLPFKILLITTPCQIPVFWELYQAVLVLNTRFFPLPRYYLACSRSAQTLPQSRPWPCQTSLQLTCFWLFGQFPSPYR